jgi:hypothetical protein
MTRKSSIPRIALRMHDPDGTAYDIDLVVKEKTGQGTLTITNAQGDVTEQIEFTRMRKGRNGKTFRGRVGVTTATLTIEDGTDPPCLHIVAQAFVPLFQATYTLSREEQQRLMAWLQTLSLASFPQGS